MWSFSANASRRVTPLAKVGSGAAARHEVLNRSLAALHPSVRSPGLPIIDPPAGAVHCRSLSSAAFDLGESSSGGALAPRGVSRLQIGKTRIHALDAAADHRLELVGRGG